MSDYFLNTPYAAPGPITATQSAPAVPIGLEVDAWDRNMATSLGGGAGRFVYARGSNVSSAGQFCMLVNGSAVALASANSASVYPIGVAAGALSATNVYGWVMVQGFCDFARGTNTAPAAQPAYMCATAGIVLSAQNNNRIFGIVGNTRVTATASSAGSYCYELNRPFAPGPMSASNAGGY